MTIASVTLPDYIASKKTAADPPLWFIVIIFWSAFAVAIVASGVIDPHLFEAQDPDSFLRLAFTRFAAHSDRPLRGRRRTSNTCRSHARASRRQSI